MNRNKWKRLLSLLLALTMMLSWNVPAVYAEDTVPGRADASEGTPEAPVPTTDCTSEDGQHSFTEGDTGTADVTATCTVIGTIKKTCSTCSQEITLNIGKDPANHAGHSTERGSLITAAGCNNNALYQLNCDGCRQPLEGQTQEDQDTGFNTENHTGLSKVLTKEPTCNEGGYTYQTCSACGEQELNKSAVGDPDPSKHVQPEGDKVHIYDATCMKPAQKGYKCTSCGNVIESSLENENETLNPANHEWDEGEEHKANCKDNAMLVQNCKNPACKDKEDAVKRTDLYEKAIAEGGQDSDPEVAALKADPATHDFSVEISITKPSTCSKPGVGKFACAGCGTQKFMTIPAAHLYNEKGVVTVEPTCLKTGKREFICERYNAENNQCSLADGVVKPAETVAKVPHKAVDNPDDPRNVAANCGEKGKMYQVCENCGRDMDFRETPVTGQHQMGTAVIVLGEKCGDAPKKGEACTICHKTENGGEPTLTEMSQAEIDAAIADNTMPEGYRAQHEMVLNEEKSSPKTCTADGTEVKTCSYCAHEESKTLPAGHDFVQEGGKDKHIKVMPNCLEAGKYVKKCEICEEEVEVPEGELTDAEKAAIAAKDAHTKIVDFDEVKATCKEPGTAAGKKCEDCGTITEGGTSTPMSTEHTWDENNVKVIRPATCKLNGMSQVTCTVCEKKEYKPIEASHTWDEDQAEIVKPATCTEAGEATITCTVCGVTGETVVLKALGHDYENGTLVEDECVAGDCTTDKVTVTKCSRCDEKKTETVPAPGHDFEGGEVLEDTESTCGTQGKKVVQCKNCDTKQTTLKPAGGNHGTAVVNLIPADCTNGTRVGLSCPECGTALGDSVVMNFTTETTEADLITFYSDNASDTGYGTAVQEADVKAKYAEWKTQAKDKALGHDWIDNIIKEAECEVAGSKNRACSRCTETEENVEIPALQHVWKITSETEPTCKADGKVTSECNLCHKVVEEPMGLPEAAWPDHTFTKQLLREATCSKSGLNQLTCSVCQYVTTEVIKGGHIKDAGSYEGTVGEEEAVAPTCTDPGKILYNCSREGCPVGTWLETVDAKGHTYGGGEYIPATCQNAALIAGKCEDCDVINEAEAYEIKTSDNVADLLERIQAYIDNPKDPSIAALRAELTEAVKAPEQKAHTYGADADHINEDAVPDPTKSVAATCTENGKNVYVCGYGCGIDAEVVVSKDTVEHHYVEQYVPATCTTVGKVKVECTICGDLQSENEIQGDGPLPHDYKRIESPLSAGKEDICVHGGTYVEICTLCDDVKNGTIAAGEHDWKVVEKKDGDTVVARVKECQRATCANKATIAEVQWTADGYGYCTAHGVQKLGADNIIPGVPATCEQPGRTDQKTCPVAGCGRVIEASVAIDALGHDTEDEGEWKVTKEPTCKEPGSKDLVCTKCGTHVIKTEEITPSNNHEYVYTTQDATCSSGELFVHKCTICGALDPDYAPQETGTGINPDNHTFDDDGNCTGVRDGVPCGATAADAGFAKCSVHGWTKTLTLGEKEATCTEEGKTAGSVCSKYQEDDATEACIYTAQTTIPATGHDKNIEWAVKVPATCKEPGVEHKVCASCNTELDSRPVAATGVHDYAEAAVEPATCSTPKRYVSKCNICGDINPNGPNQELAPADPSLHKGDENGICTECDTDLKSLGWKKCDVHGWAATMELTAVDPTCTVAGKTAGLACGKYDADGIKGSCDTIYTAQTEVPATGHDFSESNECKNGCGMKQASVTTRATTSVVNGKNKMTFTSGVTVHDEDAEIVEMGILYITAADYAGTAVEDMVVSLNESGTFTPVSGGTLRAKQFNIAQYPDLGNYVGATVTINLGDAEENKDRTLYGRGYVIVKMKDNTYAIRFADDVVSGTFNSISSGN